MKTTNACFTCATTIVLCLTLQFIALASNATEGTFADPVPASRVQDLAALQSRVHFTTLAPEVILLRDVTGSHLQHAAIFAELMQYAAQRYPGAHAVFGLYPDDPDAVGATQARWSLGMVLRQGGNAQALDAAEGNFRLAVSQPMQALTLESTLAGSRKDGMLLNAWLALSGYVQIAPTRMDYLELSASPSARVRIAIPVRQRVVVDARS